MFVLAVEYPEDGFPDYLNYHFGNLRNADGTSNPRERWTYGVVPRLFDALRVAGAIRDSAASGRAIELEAAHG